MKSIWNRELFTRGEETTCSLGGFALFLLVVCLRRYVDNVWFLPMQIILVNCHLFLVVKALKCRQRWGVDFASYVDLTCLAGGFLISPIYCLLRRHNRV